MQARGPLMIEHRLIERMLSIIRDALVQIEAKKQVDPVFVDTAVDFIRVYADRTHHGKEEDILFRELANKPLSSEDQRIMQELIEEHVFGRQTTKALVAANTRYRKGDESALTDIVAKLWLSSIPNILRRKTRCSSRHPERTLPTKRTRRCWLSSGRLIVR